MTITLSGLDLSFMKKQDESACRTGRYYYDKEKKSVRPIEERPFEGDSSAYYMKDLDAVYGDQGFVSIIDDTVITSRSQLREHNKRHGVVQCGDIRGEDLREKNKKFMRYDPSKKDPGVWVNPRNISEI